jgi:hypothetical protein
MIEFIFAVALIAGIGALFGGLRGALVALRIGFVLSVIGILLWIVWANYPVYTKPVPTQQIIVEKPETHVTIVTAAPDHAFVKEHTAIYLLCHYAPEPVGRVTLNSLLHAEKCRQEIAWLNTGDNVHLLGDPIRVASGDTVRKVRFQQWVGYVLEEHLRNTFTPDTVDLAGYGKLPSGYMATQGR